MASRTTLATGIVRIDDSVFGGSNVAAGFGPPDSSELSVDADSCEIEGDSVQGESEKFALSASPSPPTVSCCWHRKRDTSPVGSVRPVQVLVAMMIWAAPLVSMDMTQAEQRAYSAGRAADSGKAR